jgi:hypothetical protein
MFFAAVLFVALSSFAVCETEYSKSFTFVTSKPAPEGFDAWTFFWQVPATDAASRLDYVVLSPDNTEYYSRSNITRRQIPFGTEMNSGFQQGFFGGDPAVFYGKNIRIVFRVTKGDILFDPNTDYSFIFYKGGLKSSPVKTVKAEMKPYSAPDPCDVNAVFSDAVIFRTTEPAPDDFDAWKFRWAAPNVEPDAQFDYVVLEPDGSEYCRYELSKIQGRMRSDFKEGLAGSDPAVYYNKNIRFVVKTTKGDIVFDPNDKFTFVFYKDGFRGTVVETIDAVIESK